MLSPSPLPSPLSMDDLSIDRESGFMETKTGQIFPGKINSLGIKCLVKIYTQKTLEHIPLRQLKEYEQTVLALGYMESDALGRHNARVYGLLSHDGCRYLVFEYLGEMLLKEYLFKRKTFLPQGQVMLIAFSVLSALRVYAEMRFVHRGINLLNIFMVDSRCVLGPPEPFMEEDVYEAAGKILNYKAPESIEKGVYSLQTDLWSYGSLLYHAIYFSMTDEDDSLGKHTIGRRNSFEVQNSFAALEKMSETLQDLTLLDIARACMNKIPERRPPAPQIYSASVDVYNVGILRAARSRGQQAHTGRQGWHPRGQVSGREA